MRYLLTLVCLSFSTTLCAQEIVAQDALIQEHKIKLYEPSAYILYEYDDYSGLFTFVNTKVHSGTVEYELRAGNIRLRIEVIQNYNGGDPEFITLEFLSPHTADRLEFEVPENQTRQVRIYPLVG